MTPEEAAEKVLVVPAKLFAAHGYFQGFTNRTAGYLKLLCDYEHHEFRPRGEVEDDEAWKQLIPYIVVVHREWSLSYCRAEKQAERRLRTKHSIGFGGHVRPDDVRTLFSDAAAKWPSLFPTLREMDLQDVAWCGNILWCGMFRELFEELAFGPAHCSMPLKPFFAGFINEDVTSVGRVHLGLVWVVETPSSSVTPADSNVEDLEWLSLATLKGREADYEGWSRILIAAKSAGLLAGSRQEIAKEDPGNTFKRVLEDLAKT